MSQTLLAVLALALAMLLTLSMTRSRMASEQSSRAEQVSVFATDAGLEMLDHVRALPFDAAVVGLADGVLADRTALTPMPFATGGTYAAAADIDDVNGMASHAVTVGGLDMMTTATVRYVDENALTTGSSTPTYAKEVTVFVWSDASPDTLALTQVVTYP